MALSAHLTGDFNRGSAAADHNKVNLLDDGNLNFHGIKRCAKRSGIWPAGAVQACAVVQGAGGRGEVRGAI